MKRVERLYGTSVLRYAKIPIYLKGKVYKTIIKPVTDDVWRKDVLIRRTKASSLLLVSNHECDVSVRLFVLLTKVIVIKLNREILSSLG